MPAEKRNLGLVFQSYALWPHKTVFDNVAYGLKLRKVGAAEIDGARRRRARATSASASSAQRCPHQLSGGQQQRVAIARALVYNPPVILMDEPLSNLDAKLREEARAWLRELIVRMQLSALCVTHDQSEAMAMSDRILLLNNGRIEQQGTPQQMYGRPADAVHRRLHGQQQPARRAGSPKCATARRCSRATAGGCGATATARRGAPARSGTGMIRLERVRIADGAGRQPACKLPLSRRCTSATSGSTCFHLGDDAAARLRRRAARARASTGSRSRAHDFWVF